MVEEDINMWTWMVNEDMNIYMVDMDGDEDINIFMVDMDGGWRYLNIYK